MHHTAAGCVLRTLRNVAGFIASFCLLAYAPQGMAADSPAKTPNCNFTDPSLDDTSDIQGVIDYKAAIQELFAAQEFQELDCIADAARNTKVRFPDARWKLNALYWSIQRPQGHATEEDWTAHLETLRHWISARPKSITARVSLASSYEAYAWDARGSGSADTVTQSGWKLFQQRVTQARATLEEASQLKAKCPHWYVVMQDIALAEGSDLMRENALFEQAVAFEPDYYYYYRQHANFLKPQWFGAEGDAERFAAQAADLVGGPKGDVLYFQIATELICHCASESSLKLLSWPRIQSGVSELEKQNGVSSANLNILAYMAIKKKDSVVARNAFLRIGDDWNSDLWKTKAYFDSCQTWARVHAEYEDAPSTRLIREAREKFAPSIQQCAKAGPRDVTPFSLVLRLQKEGIVDAVTLLPETAVGLCLMKLNGATVSPPPYAPFTFQIEVDPAQLFGPLTK